MTHAAITGTGLYVPERIVPNSYFDQLYGKDMDTFLREKRNIVTRHWMGEDQATSDLILPAAKDAIDSAGLGVNDIDLIIVSTDTPDYLSPATAAVVQHKLGAKNAGVFDINTACAGFATALDMAGKYIKADEHYRNILVVGAYGMSKFLNMEDYKIASLFADGAGAVVVSRSEEPGLMASKLYADGQYYDYMGVYAGGTAMPITKERLEKGEHLLNFAKKIPLETNTTHWPRLTNIILDRIDAKVDDVKHFFITQINIGLINETLDSLGVPRERSHNIMDRYGYTGSACIPMAMADAAKKGQVKKGDLCFVLGSGGGVSMASLAIRWSYDT